MSEKFEKIEVSGKHGKITLVAELPLFKTMDEGIEAAAEHLPEGYVLVIKIEKFGYGVVLEDIKGNEIDLDGGDGMRSDVWAGIMKANNLPY